jgi:hypothetical protein
MLTSGDVFLLRDFVFTGTEPHYRIVVHKTASDSVILVCPSTQIEKVRQRCIRDAEIPFSMALPDQYVEIPAGSCVPLPKLCAVDCNKAFFKTELECINGFDFKLSGGKVDPDLISRIRFGIETSIVVPNMIKLAFKL